MTARGTDEANHCFLEVRMGFDQTAQAEAAGAMERFCQGSRPRRRNEQFRRYINCCEVLTWDESEREAKLIPVSAARGRRNEGCGA